MRASRERLQLPGRLTNEAQGHHWGSYHRWGASRARRSTRAATVSPGTSRPSAPRSREGQREGRRLGPPLASALRGGHGCGRETGGTLPERRNQFGRSQRSEREGGCRGRARGAGIGEEPLASRESRRRRRQLEELPGAPGQPPCAMKR